jgi:hypothetical protein
MPKQVKKTTTLESGAFLEGLFEDFAQQRHRYHQFTAHLMGLEARLELAEKTLILTRDHLEMALKTAEGDEEKRYLPRWKEESRKVRFVGMRLVDVCATVLKEHRKLTPQKLLDAINDGTFRFRTNAPLREIHAALLRHPYVKRDGNYYIWNAPPEEQITMRLRDSRQPAIITPKDTKNSIESEVKLN